MSANFENMLNKPQILGNELAELLKARNEGKIDFELIDIREPFEYEEARIKGVDKLLPITKLEQDLEKWKNLIKNKKIIIYCRTGNRTSYLQNFFKNYFDKQIPHLTYGIVDYPGEIERG